MLFRSETFKKFSKLIPEDGYLIGYGGDNNVKSILDCAKCNTISYGFDHEDLVAKDISFNERGCASFTVFKNNSKLFSLSISNPGKHNILNALASIAVGLIFNIPYEILTKSLSTSQGTHKRFEYKGVINGITVIDDYAHHPTEIKATLNTAKKIKHNKIYCVFQPHTYTRTKSLFNDFVTAFGDTDELILMDIYAARDRKSVV